MFWEQKTSPENRACGKQTERVENSIIGNLRKTYGSQDIYFLNCIGQNQFLTRIILTVFTM